MKFLGRVRNGVVVFDGPTTLPEGAVVIVKYRETSITRAGTSQKRIEFPLVPSSQPASVHLTNEMIAELLDEEDASR